MVVPESLVVPASQGFRAHHEHVINKYPQACGPPITLLHVSPDTVVFRQIDAGKEVTITNIGLCKSREAERLDGGLAREVGYH